MSKEDWVPLKLEEEPDNTVLRLLFWECNGCGKRFDPNPLFIAQKAFLSHKNTKHRGEILVPSLEPVYQRVRSKRANPDGRAENRPSPNSLIPS